MPDVEGLLVPSGAPMPGDWRSRYAEFSEMTRQVRRRCPRLPVLGISSLSPRHAPPPAQLELLRQLDGPTPRRRPPSLVSLAMRGLRCLLFALRATLGLGLLALRFRPDLQRLSRAPARVLLRTWCFGPPAPEAADDFYYGRLPQQLEARGIATVLLCGDTRERFDHAFAAAVLQPRQFRRVPELLLAPVWAPLAIAWGQLTTALALRRLGRRADDERFAAVCAAACAESLQPVTLWNTLQFYIARSAVTRWRTSVFVTFYEGQPWEQAAWQGAKAADPRCLVVGYQHTVLKPLSGSLVTPHRTAWEPAVPDVVLCLGDVTREMMAEGHQPFGNRLISFGTCRRTAGDGSGCSQPRPDRRTVLVIPEGILPEVRFLFDFATEAASRLRDHRFIFRCHPVLPFQQVRAHLRGAPERCPNIEISERAPFAADCARASVALYRGSSAVLYAVLQGLKPVYVHDEGLPDADPLFALAHWRQTVTSPADLQDGLRRYAATPEAEAAEEWRLSARYVEAYARPVDDAALDRFLEAVGLG